MKMKLNALTLAVAAGFVGSAAQAADVLLFPYVVNSATVTTIVSVVDQGVATVGYTAGGATGGSRLHWRLNYKGGANASVNSATCEEVDYYLPSSINDIQTVDLGGKFGSTTKGVLFADASVNNNWNAATTSTINFMLGKNAAAGSAERGVLFVHNSDSTTTQNLYGEALVLDFSTGAAWGYQAKSSNVTANDTTNFDFSTAATGTPILTFQPLAETTTRLFVTPVNPQTAAAGATSVATGGMLDTNGASLSGWNALVSSVSLSTSTGVAYDRDENLVSGSASSSVVCVGAVDASSLMTAGAASTLANGGWGRVAVAAGSGTGLTGTTKAILTKLEFNTTGKINGESLSGTYNNGFIMQ
jgi:hypothetical protein